MPVTLILTHDNTDFDAAAAQLAAAKVYSSAIPVLPRRLNRNVQAFLTLYGAGLPFVQAEALTRQRVQQVIVVDTQTFSPVRGMRPDTPVAIIDHHPLNHALDPNHQYTGQPLGATTTLLVEQIKSLPTIDLSTVEATLLMLGIYEDTGSLSYGTTTARDLMAAAWLLEQGANLDIVRAFLAHPLSAEQLALYSQLVKNLKIHQIGGYTALIAVARVDHNIDEISTLAHRIRDGYDATAVFIIVQMGEHIQLVARSAVDDIDVARVTEAFGGGGHARAAAASLHHIPLERVVERLLALLPTAITPAVRVEDMMSWGVKTLDASNTAADAALLMKRSGHEGYPVVANGQLIGLLTRGAVDRAISHGLAHKRVDQLMSRGNSVVYLDDSLETVQQVMLESGWGQVPVVSRDEENPNRSQLLGIITRTDLINHWQQPQPLPQDNRVVQRMQSALPRGLLVVLEMIAAEAQTLGYSLFAVGGFVRDLLLGTVNMDIDLVTEGNAVTLAQALVAQYGGDCHIHTKFGTATWTFNEEAAAALRVSLANLPPFIDFVTARREFYEAPAALPTVEQGSIKLDLLRRDFTINTLAIRLAPAPFGKLLDFYGGERDLRSRCIRVLHSLSFIDDGTRMLRAVRFEQRLGFHIEPHTEALFADALPFLNQVSGKRLRTEIDLIFDEATPERALMRLEQFGVLAAINQRLKFDEWLECAFRAARWQYKQQDVTREPVNLQEVYWAILACRLENPQALATRFQMSTPQTAALDQANRVYRKMEELAGELLPSEVVYRLGGLSDALLIAVWAIAPSLVARDKVRHYAQVLRHMRPTVNGDNLRQMGLKPGPSFGKLLSRLRDAWLNGEIHSREEERALLDRLIAEGYGHDGD